MQTSNEQHTNGVKARVERVESLLSKATVAAYGDLKLFSESIILTQMASKLSGLSACKEQDLIELGDVLADFLQCIEEYCEFIIAAATSAEERG